MERDHLNETMTNELLVLKRDSVSLLVLLNFSIAFDMVIKFS